MVEAVLAGPGERVLDVATGTGLVARALVRRYGCTDSIESYLLNPEVVARVVQEVADERSREVEVSPEDVIECSERRPID
jgi:ubiquinone/menaquinone biosynthesis C-methylase UbiE